MKGFIKFLTMGTLEAAKDTERVRAEALPSVRKGF